MGAQYSPEEAQLSHIEAKYYSNERRFPHTRLKLLLKLWIVGKGCLFTRSDCRIPGPGIYMWRCALKNEVYNNSCYSYSMRCKWLGRVFCNLALSEHLIGWKQNMKAVRSKCCKIFEKLAKLASISKNTSIPRDRRRQPRSSFVIDDYRQLIVDTKCLRERPQDGYLLH